jgi:hypothetical protein
MARLEVERVKRFALANRRSLHDVFRAGARQDLPGFNPGHVLMFADGWKIVYSIEQHPGLWAHHISVSVDGPKTTDGLPSRQGVETILALFGLPAVKKSAFVYEEDLDGGGKAINLLFPFQEPEIEQKTTKETKG